MFIVTQDGKYIYGIATAEDCGGSIKGKRIDLFYETMPETVKFGIRDCDVYFLG
jgi:3D (Asp-Asp-Asp) domain-containing protein